MTSDSILTKTKKRQPFLAALLSLIVSGLGQLYNAEPRKALLFFGISLVLPVLLFSTPLSVMPAGGFTVLLLFVGFRLLVIGDAFLKARRLQSIQLQSYNKWFVYAALAVAALLVNWITRPVFEEVRRVDLYRVPTPGMSPTMLVGDYIVADRQYYRSNAVERGDVLVFTTPDENATTYVRRCVAIEGDTIELRDGVLYLNNARAPESLQGYRRREKTYPPDYEMPAIWRGSGNTDHFGPVQIPADAYFVLGDTRDNSMDSRFFGPVPEANVRSKVKYLYFSWNPELTAPRFNRIGLKVD